jgi:ATP-dependent DNA helicase
MDEDKANQKLLAQARAKAPNKGKAKVVPKSNARVQRGGGRKRTRIESDGSSDEEGDPKRMKKEDGEALRAGDDDDEPSVFQQPALITGAQLKSYQLEGLQWMVSLDTNGISGILGMSILSIFLDKNPQNHCNAADEMGLGKVPLYTVMFN